MENKIFTQLIIKNLENDYKDYPDFVEKVIHSDEFQSALEKNCILIGPESSLRSALGSLGSLLNPVPAMGSFSTPKIPMPIILVGKLFKKYANIKIEVDIIGIAIAVEPLIALYLQNTSIYTEQVAVYLTVGTVILSIISACKSSRVIELTENPAKVYSYMLEKLRYRPINESWKLGELILAIKLSKEDMLQALTILIEKSLVVKNNDEYQVKRKMEFKLAK